ncbi:MAG: DUF1592 domain-containing protein [Sandaracinaceae bacterium]
MNVILAIAALTIGCAGLVTEPGAGGASPEGHGPEIEGGILAKRWLDDTAGPNPLRRLTMEQLRYSIYDLTGVMIDASALPPEALRDGFASFAAVQVSSETQVRGYARIAEDVAGRVDLDALVTCSAYDRPCAEALLDGFGRAVFRGELTNEERDAYLAVYDAAASLGDEEALRYVVRGLLSAPRFVYRTYAFNGEAGTTGYAVAEKLSYFLWSSTPDEELLSAAENGELDTIAGRHAEAERMLADPRAERTVDAFHRQWLRLDDLANLNPDPADFPEFSDELPASYAEETLAAAREAFFDPDGTLTMLLASDTTHVDGALADLYGYAAPDTDFETTSVGAEPRRGVLMMGATMARLSTLRRSEPIYRGAFILNQVLCRDLELPGDLNVMLPEPDPSLPYRQQIEELTSETRCASCHSYINQLGFALDQFDALGRFRPMENGFAIDTAVEIRGLGELNGEYADGAELVAAIARSDLATECYAEKWYELAMGRARDPEADAAHFGAIYETFQAQDQNLQALVLAIVDDPAF